MKKAAKDKKEVDEDCDYREEAIEETVEVPLSELADLLRLAGYENYEEKLAEYDNAPDEEYFDVEDQLIGLAGGLNRPKTMHPTVAGGDNPMAVIPIKVDEADMFEKIYQNYQSFVKEATTMGTHGPRNLPSSAPGNMAPPAAGKPRVSGYQKPGDPKTTPADLRRLGATIGGDDELMSTQPVPLDPGQDDTVSDNLPAPKPTKGGWTAIGGKTPAPKPTKGGWTAIK